MLTRPGAGSADGGGLGHGDGGLLGGSHGLEGVADLDHGGAVELDGDLDGDRAHVIVERAFDADARNLRGVAVQVDDGTLRRAEAPGLALAVLRDRRHELLCRLVDLADEVALGAGAAGGDGLEVAVRHVDVRLAAPVGHHDDLAVLVEADHRVVAEELLEVWIGGEEVEEAGIAIHDVHFLLSEAARIRSEAAECLAMDSLARCRRSPICSQSYMPREPVSNDSFTNSDELCDIVDSASCQKK